MKKIIVIIAAIAIAAGGYAAVKMFVAQGSAVDEILPEGAMYVGQIADMSDSLEKAAESPLGVAISEIDFSEVIEQSGLTNDQKEGFVSIIDQIKETSDNEILREVFDDEVVLAFYPIIVEELSLESGWDALSHFFFVTELKPHLQVVGALAKWFNQKGVDVTVSTQDYNGYSIKMLEIPNEQYGVPVRFSSVIIGKYLVFGIGDRATKSSVDVATKTKKSLKGDETYQSVKKDYLPGADSNSYYNLALFLSSIKDSVSNVSDQVVALGKQQSSEANDIPSSMIQEELERSFDLYAGLDIVSSSTKESDGLTTIRSYLYFDEDELDPFLRQSYVCEPEKNETINFIPRDVMIYSWATCMDMESYWTYMKENSRSQQIGQGEVFSPDQVFAMVENFLGYSLEEDILPALGDEVGGFLVDISTGGPFPVPEFALFFKVDDRAVIEGMMDKVTNQPLLMMQEKEHEGVTIHFVGMAYGQSLQPAYAFIDDYFIISTSRRTLEQSVDSYAKKAESIDKNTAFSQVDSNLTKPSNGISFFKIDAIVEKIESVFDWGINLAQSSFAQKKAFAEGSRRRLQDLKAEVLSKEIQMAEYQMDLKSLKERSKSGDLAVKVQIEDTQSRIEALKIELSSEQEQVKELEEVVAGYKDTPITPENSRVFYNEVLLPIFQALQEYSAWSMRSVSQKDKLETTHRFIEQ